MIILISVLTLELLREMKMKTNEKLQRSVQNAIKWEPLLHAAEIGVSVKDGVVTLSGIVDSYAKKLEAEEAAKKVLGVRAVAQNIKVEINDVWNKNDTEIATTVLNALKLSLDISSENINIEVEKGYVTLNGELPWYYLKELTEKTVSQLLSVNGVANKIVIVPNIKNFFEEEAIKPYLSENWLLANCDINISITKSQATLTGVVKSLYQKDLAERIVWNSPGVSSVNNNILKYSYSTFRIGS